MLAPCSGSVARYGRQAHSSARFSASCLPNNRLEGASCLGEFTLGVARNLDYQHVAGGPVHNLRWDGAELVIPNGA